MNLKETMMTGKFQSGSHTARLQVKRSSSPAQGFLLQVAVLTHADLAHILALLVGGVISAFVLTRVVLTEESGAKGCDGQAGDEDDDNDGGVGQLGHGGEMLGELLIGERSVVIGGSGEWMCREHVSALWRNGMEWNGVDIGRWDGKEKRKEQGKSEGKVGPREKRAYASGGAMPHIHAFHALRSAAIGRSTPDSTIHVVQCRSCSLPLVLFLFDSSGGLVKCLFHFPLLSLSSISILSLGMSYLPLLYMFCLNISVLLVRSLSFATGLPTVGPFQTRGWHRDLKIGFPGDFYSKTIEHN